MAFLREESNDPCSCFGYSQTPDGIGNQSAVKSLIIAMYFSMEIKSLLPLIRYIEWCCALENAQKYICTPTNSVTPLPLIFIRNQGNIYVLQKIPWLTTLDMAKRYLKLSKSDVTEAHRKTSPLKHLKFDPLADYKTV